MYLINIYFVIDRKYTVFASTADPNIKKCFLLTRLFLIIWGGGETKYFYFSKSKFCLSYLDKLKMAVSIPK